MSPETLDVSHWEIHCRGLIIQLMAVEEKSVSKDRNPESSTDGASRRVASVGVLRRT